MENLYYTPEIEEFHVGFEFEYLGKDGKWNEGNLDDKKIINKELDQFPDDLDKLAHAITRVKYLDKEDIESLGWVLSLNSKDNPYFKINNEKYTLVFWTEISNEISNVYIRQEYGLGMQCFKGIIKNKSELKKLMKQLGIEV